VRASRSALRPDTRGLYLRRVVLTSMGRGAAGPGRETSSNDRETSANGRETSSNGRGWGMQGWAEVAELGSVCYTCGTYSKMLEPLSPRAGPVRKRDTPEKGVLSEYADRCLMHTANTNSSTSDIDDTVPESH
jgi:hypothetical protein